VKRKLGIFALSLATFFLLGMPSLSTAQAGDALKVFVSIVPQKYFVKKIGGDLVDVSVMVQPGASPATYEPKPKQMVDLSRAKVYFAIGVPFEKAWFKKIISASPKMLVVHTEAGIEKIPMKEDKPNGIKDPHIWLSPPLVKVQAKNIMDALQKVDLAHSSVYKANYKKFIREIDNLDAELRRIFLEKEEERFMVFHPAWGYFARIYGLKMVPVESEGKTPKPKALQRLIETAKRDGIKVVFVQPEFSTKNAEIISKSIGGEVVFASPLNPDWPRNLKEVAEKFRAALR
jgi:zinc transport system substrate-binding protein